MKKDNWMLVAKRNVLSSRFIFIDAIIIFVAFGLPEVGAKVNSAPMSRNEAVPMHRPGHDASNLALARYSRREAIEAYGEDGEQIAY